VFAGAAVLVLTGCLAMSEAYQTIEWKAVFLIAGMWPLSTAIRTTGLADQTIQGLLQLVGGAAPLMVALALILVALLLTQIMSSQVAALVLAPLALVAAGQIGADPRALAMAVALGCSLCFPTPFGHPVNIMVMTPGGYQFKDYVRVGLPLTVIVIALILVGLRVFWGL
jgi:di/tricarboxylate transporter